MYFLLSYNDSSFFVVVYLKKGDFGCQYQDDLKENR